ncbi:permease prefix domain 1-containing protein [Flavilitoribacter nigricans]|uniref:Uncharacterized protein n=1 Tax=Flavilitoribacter nigricans (strain ATCC 23147 / DSM 23189 / NBRC 102662 / NCIMB 1420 / SS-2) TaxID=1122177 RepID=A0A2D0NC33_FLAN2|nr:permease prefix domain 1-containing protein [Flavilitoribacter nigricans]PHN05938.1 hypothetical protein CRP01_13240 [Flavilitoribacter nigricans DSM 23189 = NBRC 102662]
MHTPDHFNLSEAIEQYLSRIDRYQLLSYGQREELLDHLLTETEELQAAGWSEQQAFSIAIEQFGSSELISREYEQIRPFFNIRKAAIAASLLVFCFMFLVGLLYALSLGSTLIAKQFYLMPPFTTYLDLSLKVVILGTIAWYVRRRFRAQQPLRSWEAALIPVLGLVSPFVISYCLFYQGYVNLKVLLTGHYTSFYLLIFLMLAALIGGYREIFKLQQPGRGLDPMANGDRKARAGIIVTFFFAFAIFSLINAVSSFSMWLSYLSLLETGWVQMLDLVLKLMLLGGVLAVVASRIQRQAGFKRYELLLVPLLGAAGPFISEYLLLGVAALGKFDRVFFGTINYNSKIVLGIVFIAIIATTYLLMYRERKQIRTTA